MKVMSLIKVKCAFCGKEFFRRKKQFNEAKKFDWKQYCSWGCLSRDKLKRQILFCENCDKRFSRAPNDISPHNYCSQSCAAIVNNKRYPKPHPEPKFKICVKCGKQFRKSTGNTKYCSIKCRKETEWYDRKKLLEIIRNTTQKLKRVPVRREVRGIDKACGRFFGSWNNAIIAAGLLPNRSHSQRMYKRTNTVALDGHLCDSVSEALIDNWLTKNNILHERNVTYPKTNHKTDWAVFVRGEKIFIEYFGLANDSPRYDRAIREKKNLCRKYRLQLIEIYPQDLYPEKNLSRKLEDKLRG